jgi:hypothetical protein
MFFWNVLQRTHFAVCVTTDVADLFALPRANGPIGRPTYTRSQNRTCTWFFTTKTLKSRKKRKYI